VLTCTIRPEASTKTVVEQHEQYSHIFPLVSERTASSVAFALQRGQSTGGVTVLQT